MTGEAHGGTRPFGAPDGEGLADIPPPARDVHGSDDSRPRFAPDLVVRADTRPCLASDVDALAAAHERVLDRPLDADAAADYADALGRVGALREAIEAYRRIPPGSPLAARALAGTALAVLRSGRVDVAAELAGRVAALPGSAGIASAIAAVVLASAGRLAEARAQLERAPPEGAQSDRAEPLKRAHSIERAQLERAPRTESRMPSLALARSLVEIQAAGTDAARVRSVLAKLSVDGKAAEKSVAISSSDAMLAMRFAGALARCGDEVGAAAWCRAVGDVHRGAAELVPPLRWPRRSAGSAARIAVLEKGGISYPGIPSSSDDVTVVRVVLDAVRNESAVAAQPMLAAADWPAETIARAIAELDADVLVDRVGAADSRVGAVLALDPARLLLLDTTAAGMLPREWGLHHGVIVERRALRADGESSWEVSVRAGDDADAEALASHRDALGAVVAAWRRWSAGASPACDPGARELAAAWKTAVLAHRAGNPEEAERGYRELLASQPGFAPAWYMRGMLARKSRDAAAAKACLQEALRTGPRYLDARLALATLLAEDGDADGARSLLATDLFRSARAKARMATALADIAGQVGDADEELRRLHEAVEHDPADAASWTRIGSLVRRTDASLASRALRNAAALSPADATAAFNLATHSQEQGDFAGARRQYERSIALRPDFARAYRQLGDCLFAHGDVQGWIDNFRRFESRCPASWTLAAYALHALPYAGDLDGVDRWVQWIASATIPRASAGVVDGSDDADTAAALEELLYLLLFVDVAPALMRRLYERYDEVATSVYGGPHRRSNLPSDTAGDAAQQRRVRLGYLSGDVREHVMGRMSFEAIRFHDADRFEVFLYRANAKTDSFTSTFESAVEHARDVSTLGDSEAVALIESDGLDVLVDLSTHTEGARPAILAAKPAPVQATFVASAGATGLRAIDFKLSDELCDPPANQAWLLEELLEVEGGAYPIRFPVRSATPMDRRSIGIAGEAPAIAAFVNPMKLSRRCLRLWSAVMRRVPDAFLVFSPNREQERGAYLRLAEAGGIPAARVAFAPQFADEARNLGRYGVADIVLDTMPFGGVNGTLEALAAGVPVVTLRGAKHGERTTSAILQRLGLPQTICESEEQYVDRAVAILGDRALRGELSSAIEASVSSWCEADARAYTRRLEDALLDGLRRRRGRRA